MKIMKHSCAYMHVIVLKFSMDFTLVVNALTVLNNNLVENKLSLKQTHEINLIG